MDDKNIKIVTLVNGLNLMSDIIEGEDDVMLTQPVQVAMIPSSNNRQSLGIAPYLEFTEEFKTGIRIMKKQVVTITTPISDLADKYRSLFSGIILPQ